MICAPHALTLPGTAQGVRDALQHLTAGPLCNLPEGERGAAQIVLAEVLNNIVEHAGAAQIELRMWQDSAGLRCRIIDGGAPMPAGQLPAGHPPPPDDLPEGGFGWFLIRSFARDLDYRRVDGRNELSFLLPSP